MKINKITNINFKSTNEMSQPIAPRSQQQNKVNFEKEKMIARKADSVEANPLTSLGYKLYRTFRIISEHEPSQSQQSSLNVVA